MDRRATASEETRRRILQAALELHSAKGVGATSWQDIAETAGVAVGTVYYHFPTVDHLVPACSGYGFESAPVPTKAIFAGARTKSRRVEVLVREVFAFYEALSGPLRHTFAERATIPAVGRLAAELRAQFRLLVQEALVDASPQALSKAEALIDFRVWDSFREQKLDRKTVVSTVTDLILRISAR